MIWHIEILKIYLEEQLLIKYYVIKHLILLNIYNRYGGNQRDPASMVYKFFDKKTAGGAVKNKIKQNNGLAEELHKPVIRKFQK